VADTKLNWEGKTKGGSFGQKSIVIFLQILPIQIVYSFIYFFAFYYMLFSRKGYKAMYYYFREILKHSAWASFWKTFRNHYLFGQVIIDRFAVFSGAKINFQIETEGKHFFDNLLAAQTGGIVVSTHAGNFELAGYLMKLGNYKLNGVIFGGESPVVMEHRKRILAQNNITPIVVSENLSHIFEINSALKRNELISMPGDRYMTGNKRIETNFLGKKAIFPSGAFHIADKMKVPALAFFVMKDKALKYHIYVKPINVDVSGITDSNKRVEMMAIQYVNELELILKKYPEQWFNYYNFWDQN